MFGSSSTPFGSSSGGFGTNTTPAFGTPAPAPFGAPSPSFGGGFGAPAPAPSGFGGFGAPAPAPSGFGGGFGTPAPAPSAFGSTGGFGASTTTSSPFGAPAPAPSGGLFGSAPAPSGGLFGSAPAPAPGGFGSTSTGFGGFGSSTTSTFGGGSTFGTPAPAPSTGLFGAAPAPSFGSSMSTGTFGTPAPAPSGGLFGAPAPAPSGGLFGAPAPAAAAAGGGGGTKMTPYQATSRQDGTSSISLQAITAMPAYESKSFEELRFEDYSQGNKGAGTQGGAGGFGGFGTPAPAPTGGLFGSSPAPAPFGAPAPAPGGFGGFGAPAPAPFGAPAPSLFGAPAPAPFGAPAPAPFGAPAPAPPGGLFGAPAPAPPGGLFGAPAPAPGGGLFGAPAPAPPGGLFGSPAPASAFGAPAPSGGLFGAPAPAPPGGLFGAPAAAPPPAFGTSSTFGTSGGFGSTFGAPAPQPSTGLFGAPAPPPAFGTPASGSLFGAPAPPGGGLFGPKPPGTGLFGTPTPAPPPAFGVPSPAQPLFGPAPAPAMPAAPPVGSVMPPAANEILTSRLQALENQRKELEQSDNFRRKPTESSAINALSVSENDALSALTPARPSHTPYRASPRSSARVRPRGYAPSDSTTPSLSKLGSASKPLSAPDTMAASSVTRLVINPDPKPKIKLLTPGPSSESKSTEESPLRLTALGSSTPKASLQPLSSLVNDKASPKAPVVETIAPPPRSDSKSPKTRGRAYEYYQDAITSPENGGGGGGESPAKKRAMVPILTKAGYTCSPSIQDLRAMSPEDLATVAKFTVERAGVGKIEWEGAVDVRGVDLDVSVVIETKSASVYMKEEAENAKPPAGTKLNRPAIITLEGVFPPSTEPGSLEKFSRRVKRNTEKMGAELINYDADTGEWKLRVQHFSRYALTDDDTDSDAEGSAHFESGEREGRSLAVRRGILKKGGAAAPAEAGSQIVAVRKEEKEDVADEETAIVSDVEMADESKGYAEAENALTSIKQALDAEMAEPADTLRELTPFGEEFVDAEPEVNRNKYTPSVDDLEAASTMGGITRSIAHKVGVKSSGTDYGLRMRGSFGVAWSPDGSFLRFQRGGALVRQRPVFTESAGTDANHVALLQTHKLHACRNSGVQGCSNFSLPLRENDHDKLQKTLESYSQASKEAESENSPASIPRQAFSLLGCLLDGKKDQQTTEVVPYEENVVHNSFDSRLIYSVKQWLVAVCSDEVNAEIKSAKAKRDVYSALLAAVTGGDVAKASNLADELGLPELAELLTLGSESTKDILKEVMTWTDRGTASTIPDELIRVYFLLGGDLKMEEDIYIRKYSPFDWRRRLVMRLAYSTPEKQLTLPILMQDYEDSLAKGTVPYPHPRYLSSKSRKEVQCVLYRLLQSGKRKLEVTLRDVIDPLGYTSAIHDFSLSFHLASAVSAIGSPSPLSDIEEQTLLDGYSAQLIAGGNWEWAVYVTLCSLGNKQQDQIASWKENQAKTLVLRNFSGSEEDSQKRIFLESVGVPAGWFAESLAIQCHANGDAFGYMTHILRVSPQKACDAMETVAIPSMLFLDKENLVHARRLLEVFSEDDRSLSAAMFDFFQVYERVRQMEKSGMTRSEMEKMIPTYLVACDVVEEILTKQKSHEAKLRGPSLRLVPESRVIPMQFFLAEALSQVALLRVKLISLEAGIGIASTGSQLMNLVGISSKHGQEMKDRENICRWFM